MYIDNIYYLNKVRGYLFKICGVIIVSGCLHSYTCTCTHNIEMGRPWCYPGYINTVVIIDEIFVHKYVLNE